jgi:hypothetical protein
MEKGSNELYQQELLAIFKVTQFEELSTTIEQLYDQMKENNQLQEILKMVAQKYTWANRDHCFYLLFSYDYLYITHDFMKDILIQSESIHYDFLYSKFK